MDVILIVRSLFRTSLSSASSEYSTQRQVFHHKFRNKSSSSTQRQVSHHKFRNKGCSSAERQVFHCKNRNPGCSSAQRLVFLHKFRNKSCSSTQRQVFHCKCSNQSCSSAEGSSSTANPGTQAAVLLGMDSCGSFPLLSAFHSLCSF